MQVVLGHPRWFAQAANDVCPALRQVEDDVDELDWDFLRRNCLSRTRSLLEGQSDMSTPGAILNLTVILTTLNCDSMYLLDFTFNTS